MKVGFEAKRFFRNFTGLGNYSRFVVDALSKYAPENQFFLYTPRNSDHKEVVSITNRQNVKVIVPPPLYTNVKLTSLWRSWGVSQNPSIQTLDVFHGLSHEVPFGLPKKVKKVVTVHDLIFIRYPRLYNRIDAAIYKTKLVSACNAAEKIIAISHQTAEDIVDFLKVKKSKIEVIYQGPHSIFNQRASENEIAHVKEKYNLPSEYILNVGTIEERKNIKVLVKALALLKPSERCPLVIVGRPTDYLAEVKKTARECKVLESITFLHSAAFSDFPALYQGAKVFVYPSVFEGFGIPLVEAIQSAVPVITSKGSCFQEAAGPNSIYVDTTNEEELAFQLHNVLADENLRKNMVLYSLDYIKRFSPDVIAGNLLSLYKSL